MTSTIKRFVFSSKRLWFMGGGFLFLAITILPTYWASSSSISSDIRWLPVEPQILESQLGLVGRIEAATHTVITAPFEGLVKKLVVAEGQRVERGQLLLTLDTVQLDIQIREALAAKLKAQRAVQVINNWEQSEEVSRARRALTNARLNLDNTEAALADTRRLFERGIVARMDVDSLEQQAKGQRLDFAAAQAELRAVISRGEGEDRQIAEMELANAQARHQALVALHAERELYAPFAGIVLLAKKEEGGNDTRPSIQPGLRVSQGTSLFELVSLERIKAVARIEEADLHQLSEGMPVQITGDGFAGMTLHGRIASIGVQAISSSYGGASYDVVVSIEPLTPEQIQRMRLGMSARLTITTYRSESGLAVPAEALKLDVQGNATIKYRKSMNEAPQWQSVTVGRAVPQGVEIFGIGSGYVALSDQRQ